MLLAGLGSGAGCDTAGSSADLGPADALDQASPPDLRLDLAPDAGLAGRDGGAPLGSGCSLDLDCAPGLSCDVSLPGGLCTRSCGEHADCGAEDRWGCVEGRCVRACDVRAPQNPCRPDYVCQLREELGLCVPDCRVAGCNEPALPLCDSSSGLCLDPKSGSFGDPCGTFIGGCQATPNGQCAKPWTKAPGFCSVPCTPFANPCAGLPFFARCMFGLPKAPLCGVPCDPDKPSCPNPQLSCLPYGGGHVCLYP